MRFRYHCSRCRRWHRFRRKVSDYILPRKCWYCGYDRFYRVGKRKQKTCGCWRLAFPHRYSAECAVIREALRSPSMFEDVPEWVLSDV